MNTEARKKIFLAAFMRVGTIKGAAARASIDRKTAYNWKVSDAKFREAMEASEVDITENLEEVAYERAMRGDNTMLIFLLKARAPQKYMERYRHEIESAQLGRLIGLVTSVLRRTVPRELHNKIATELAALEHSIELGENEPALS